MLTDGGPALTAVEARAAARTLAAGAHLTARTLDRAHPQRPDGSPAGAHLRAAAKHLHTVANAEVASLGPPTPSVLSPTQQICLQLTAARELTDQLLRTPGSPAGRDRIALPLLAWAGEAAATTASLAGCLQRLLTPASSYPPKTPAAVGAIHQEAAQPRSTVRGQVPRG